MKTLVEYFIRRRNPAFRFDGAISTGMVLSFFLAQSVRLMRGCKLLFRFRAPRGMLLGRGVRFSYLHRIHWGRFLKLDDGVYLSGLSRSGLTFGHNVGIGAHSRIVVSTTLNDPGQHITIGSNVGIGEFAYLGGAGGLEIGDDTIVGQYFSCHPENHVYADPAVAIRHQGVTRQGIVIGRNCWIGSKVTILDGVQLGDGCVVAAGAVVTRSFADNSVIGGIPARLLRHRSGSESIPQNHAA